MSFDSFNLRASSRGVLASQGITTPTEIQDQSIPIMLAGADMVGQAHTGSGKTLAFGLPLIEKCDATSKSVQALVLVPTRELALQVAGVLTDLARPAGLSLAVLYGGVGLVPQFDALKKGVQIVVGTPGRVLDHLSRRTLDLRSITLLILDEADQMLDRGFAPDVERIISTTPRSRQTALFSATTPEWVLNVASKHLRQPTYISVHSEEEAPDIEHSVIESWAGDKLPVLLALLDQPSAGSTLVFGRTRHGVMNLARRLQNKGYDVEALQGDLGQAARERIVKRFRSGHVPILLATNVAARGLDMLNIDRVINYELPESGELFVHRVGRTGRMGRWGQAITIIAATDLQKMQEIERYLGKKLRRVPISQLETLAQRVTERAPIIDEELDEVIETELAQETAAPAKRRRRRARRPGTAPAGVAQPVTQGAPA